MTTRFFDFRRYAYKGKACDLPEIRKKNESSPSISNSLLGEDSINLKNTTLQKNLEVDDYSNYNKFPRLSTSNSKINSPKTHKSHNRIASENVKEKKYNLDKEIKNSNKSYNDFHNTLFSSSQAISISPSSLSNSQQAKHNLSPKLAKNAVENKMPNESKPNSPIVVRKRLKRILNYDFDDSPTLEKEKNHEQAFTQDLFTSHKNFSGETSSDNEDHSAFQELQECLKVSEEMKQKIIEALGGNVLESRKLIENSFHNGRFNAHQSYALPEHFTSIAPQIQSKLKEYQKCGIHWLITLHDSHRNGILADEMGLGKTAQTCVFLNYLYASGKVSSPSVIASPASLLDNWFNELELWAPSLKGRVMKYHGKQTERRELILDFIQQMHSENCYYILITSINTLANNWDLQYLKQIKPLAYLAVDEAHSLKNEKSQVYRKLNKTFSSDRRLLITGSPIQNKTFELKNLLLFVMPHVFNASSLDTALEYYEKQIYEQTSIDLKMSNNNSSINDSNKNSIDDNVNTNSLEDGFNCLNKIKRVSSSPDVQCLQMLLGPFILRRLKTEVLCDLPAKKSIVLRCQIVGRQANLYMSEIKQKNSRLVLSLQKLQVCKNSSNLKNDSIEINTENDKILNNPTIKIQETSSDNYSSDTERQNRVDTDRNDTGNSNKQFVNSLISRLRRICNHPLLMQGHFTNDQITEIIDHYHKRVQGYMGNPRKKVESEIRKWSDFEIHQEIQALMQSNDKSLEKFLLPKDALLESAKIRSMLQIVEDIFKNGEKVLIFSQFTTFLNIIEECLTSFLPMIQYCRLDGATNVVDRQNVVDSFNNSPKIVIFLLSTKAGGQGLNLSSARNVILMDQDWNPQNDRQAEDRVHRLGQTQDVIVYRLCCRATIEESILECCQKKLDLDEAFGGDSELLQLAILQESFFLSQKLSSQQFDT